MFQYPCKVVRVIDGDTLDVDLDLGFDIHLKERVRLIGLDAPEIFGGNGGPAGQEAKKFVETWVAYHSLSAGDGMLVYSSLRYHATDKYGRSLGTIVWIGKDGYRASLNDDLLSAGQADPA